MNYQPFSKWTEPDRKDILLCYQNGLIDKGRVGAVIKFNSKLAYRFFGRGLSTSALQYLTIDQLKQFNSLPVRLCVEEDPLGQQNLTIDSCTGKSLAQLVEIFCNDHLIYCEVSRKLWSVAWSLHATVYPGVQGMSARVLLEEMENISEKGYDAGWMLGLEYELWGVICEGKETQYGRYLISAEEVKLLRFLALQAGGWWQWSDGLGPLFRPLTLKSLDVGMIFSSRSPKRIREF